MRASKFSYCWASSYSPWVLPSVPVQQLRIRTLLFLPFLRPCGRCRWLWLKRARARMQPLQCCSYECVSAAAIAVCELPACCRMAASSIATSYNLKLVCSCCAQLYEATASGVLATGTAQLPETATADGHYVPFFPLVRGSHPKPPI